MAVDMGSAIAYLLLDTTNFNTALSGAQNGLVSAGAKMASAGATMTATVTRGLIKLGQAAVTESANFESAMSQVRATMLKSTEEFNNEIGTVTIGAGENMREFTGNLTDFALEMASTTKFTASETAAALNYMALAGYNTQESMQMLPNVLNLAAAGAMDLARASDMVTDTQTAFGISFERTTKMVDEMAKAASTGNTNVEQLGEAFLTVGGLAKNLNGGMVTLTDGTSSAVDGVQELEIALTAMANAGIKGGEAGTHMRNVLLKLSSPTSEGAKQFRKLGVEAFDAQGNMKSLSTIFGDLGTSLGKLTQQEKLQAIGEIFNVRDIAAAESLLAAVGEDWDSIGESILDAEGAAQKMADIQLDNLNGQITILKSGLQTVAIQFGNLMLPYLKRAVGFVQNLTKWLSRLDDKQKTTVMRLALIAAAIGPVLLIAGRLISVIGMLSQGFSVLGGTGAGGALFLAAGIAILVSAFVNLYNKSEEFRESVKNSWDNLSEFIKGFTDKVLPKLKDTFDAIVEAAEPLVEVLVGIFEDVTTWLKDKALPALENFADVLKQIAESEEVKNFFSALGTLISNCRELIKKLGTAFEEFDKTSSISLKDVIDKALMLVSAVTDVINAINSLFNKDYPGAEVNLKSALNKLNDVLNWAFGSYNSTTSSITDLISDMFSSFVKSASQSENPFMRSLGKILSFVQITFDTMGSIIRGITDIIKSVFGQDLGPDGQKIVNSLKGGLQSAWDELTGWFDSLPVINFAKKILGGGLGSGTWFSGGGSGGHFATGLDYVPRTMNVTVHRGERILTQKENEEYSKGGSVEVVTYQNDEAINKLNATMDKLLTEVEGLKEMQVVLDGKRMVGGLISEIDRQLGKRAERAGGAA